MASFEEHHGANDMWIRADDGRVYHDTWQNFELDYGTSLEELPVGADERMYFPGVRHAINDTQGNTIAGGSITWAYGDNAIAAIASLLSAQETRLRLNA